jgi:uncharacterized protein (DUF983 family)
MQATAKPPENERSAGLGWALRGILSNRCPRCGRTHVFRHLVFMAPSCAGCGYVYERENGYFLGAIVIGYFSSAFAVVPTVVIGVMALRASILDVVLAASLQVLVLTPFISRFARLGWIYLDYRADPRGNTEYSSNNSMR